MFYIYLERMYVLLLKVFFWMSNWLIVFKSYIPVDFLSTYSASYWERNVEIPDYNCKFVSFLFFNTFIEI